MTSVWGYLFGTEPSSTDAFEGSADGNDSEEYTESECDASLDPEEVGDQFVDYDETTGSETSGGVSPDGGSGVMGDCSDCGRMGETSFSPCDVVEDGQMEVAESLARPDLSAVMEEKDGSRASGEMGVAGRVECSTCDTESSTLPPDGPQAYVDSCQAKNGDISAEQLIGDGAVDGTVAVPIEASGETLNCHPTATKARDDPPPDAPVESRKKFFEIGTGVGVDDKTTTSVEGEEKAGVKNGGSAEYGRPMGLEDSEDEVTFEEGVFYTDREEGRDDSTGGIKQISTDSNVEKDANEHANLKLHDEGEREGGRGGSANLNQNNVESSSLLEIATSINQDTVKSNASDRQEEMDLSDGTNSVPKNSFYSNQMDQLADTSGFICEVVGKDAGQDMGSVATGCGRMDQYRSGLETTGGDSAQTVTSVGSPDVPYQKVRNEIPRLYLGIEVTKKSLEDGPSDGRSERKKEDAEEEVESAHHEQDVVGWPERQCLSTLPPALHIDSSSTTDEVPEHPVKQNAGAYEVKLEKECSTKGSNGRGGTVFESDKSNRGGWFSFGIGWRSSGTVGAHNCAKEEPRSEDGMQPRKTGEPVSETRSVSDVVEVQGQGGVMPPRNGMNEEPPCCDENIGRIETLDGSGAGTKYYASNEKLDGEASTGNGLSVSVSEVISEEELDCDPAKTFADRKYCNEENNIVDPISDAAEGIPDRDSVAGEGISEAGRIFTDNESCLSAPQDAVNQLQSDEPEIFPDARGFLADQEDHDTADDIPLDDVDDDLLESFRPDENDRRVAKVALNENRKGGVVLQNKKKKIDGEDVDGKAHPNQALFDILNRNMASIEPLPLPPPHPSHPAVSGATVYLTADDVKLCYVAFVATFSPPHVAPYAEEYNNVAEVGRTGKDSAEEGNTSVPEKLTGHSRMNRRSSGAVSAGGHDSEAAQGSMIKEPSSSNKQEKNRKERPYVPTRVVHALWEEVLKSKLGDARDKSADDCRTTNGFDDICTEPGRNISEASSEANVTYYVQDFLVSLGLLDVRKVTDTVKTKPMDTRHSDGVVNSMGKICGMAQRIHACEMMAVHQDIHQEYGEYLAGVEYAECVDEHEQQWNAAVASACLENQDEGGGEYAMQMLPWNMIRAGQFDNAFEVLGEKKFVFKRLLTMGTLSGATAQVTDVDGLILRLCAGCHVEESTINPKDAILQAYTIVEKIVSRQFVLTADEGISTGAATSVDTMEADIDDVGQKSLCKPDSKTEAGKALHLMGVSLGAHGHLNEEMEFYNKAIRLKRGALVSDTSDVLASGTSTITISDTLHCMGFAYDNSGNYAAAIECYDEALGIRRMLLGNDDLRVAETCHNKGAILCENGECENAMGFLQEALRIRNLHFGPNHEECADTQQWMGNVMREWEDYDEALFFFKNALRIKKLRLGDDHEDVANTLQNMATVLDDMAKYDLSMDCYRESLRIRQLNLGKENLLVADTYQCMAQVCTVTEEHDDALRFFTQSIEIREHIISQRWDEGVDEDNAVETFISGPTPCVGEDAHECKKLMECYEEALPLTKLILGSNHNSVWALLHRMGDVYAKLHDWDNAIGSFQGAVRVRRASFNLPGNDDLEVGLLLQKKGRAHSCRGEYQRAKSSFDSALRIRKSVLGCESILVASTMYCLGVSLFNTGEHRQAILCFNEVLRVWEKELGDTHLHCGHAAHWLGRAHEELNDFDKALRSYRAALRVYKQHKRTLKSIVVIKTLHFMGKTHGKREDLEKAMKCYNEEIRLIRLKLGAQNEELASALFDAGIVCEKKQDFDLSIGYLENALEVMTTCWGEHNERVCETMDKLGTLQVKRGNFEEARVRLADAYRLYESVVGHDQIVTASALYKLGCVLETQESHPEAMKCYKESLRVRRLKLGDEHEDVANTFFSMGVLFLKQDQNDAAIECFQQTLAIRKNLLADSDMLVASTQHQLAKAYHKTDSHDKAMVLFNESLRIRKQNGDEQNAEVAEVSVDMALSHEDQQNYDLAVKCYAEALRICSRRSRDDENVPVILRRMGGAYENLEDYKQAARCFAEALEIYKRKDECDRDNAVIEVVTGYLAKNLALTGADESAIAYYTEHVQMLRSAEWPHHQAKIADSLYAMGKICANRHDFESALDNLKECLGMRRKYFGNTDLKVSEVLFDIAVIHEKTESFDMAMLNLTEALRIYKLKSNHVETASTLHVMGRVLKKMCDIDSSMEALQEALRIREEVLPTDDLQLASTRHLYACILLQREDYTESEKLFQMAYRTRKTKLGMLSIEASDSLYKIGEILSKKRDYDKAINCLEQVLEARRSTLGNEHLDVANCLYSLGIVLSEKGNYRRAISCLLDAVHARANHLGADSIEVGATWHALGKAYGMVHENDDAFEALVKALRIRKVKLGNDSLDCAHTLRQLGEIQESLKKPFEAENCYLEALRVYTLQHGKNHISVGMTLENLGNLCLKTSDYDNASAHFHEALNIYQRNLGDDNNQVANVLFGIGKAYHKRGRFDESIEYYKRTLSVRNMLGDEDEAPAVLLEIGQVLESKGNVDNAMECYEEVLSTMKLQAEDDTKAKAHHKIGGIHLEREEFDLALQYLQQALAIHRRLFGKDGVDTAHTMMSIASVYDARREHDLALKTQLDALRILKLNLSGDDLSVAVALNSIGNNYARRKSYSKAIEVLTEALRIRKLELGNEHVKVCDTLFNIANVLEEWGKEDQAMHWYVEALGLYRSTLGTDGVGVANCLQHIGSIRMREGENEEALNAFTESLGIYQEQCHGEDDLNVASVQFGLGKIFSRRSDDEKALECFAQSLRTRKTRLGDDDISVAAVCEQIGHIYSMGKRPSEAMDFYNEALRVFALKQGKDHVNYANVLAGQASVLSDQEEFDLALSKLHECLTINKDVLGDETDEVASILVKIGIIHNKRVDYEEALRFLNSSLEIRRNVFGNDHEKVAETILEMGGVFEDWGDSDEAIESYLEVLRIGDVRYGPACHEMTAKVHNRLGGIYLEREEFDLALQSLQHAHGIYCQLFGENAVERGHTMQSIASVHDARSEYDQAMQTNLDALRILKLNLGDDDLSVALVLNNIGINYARRKNYSKAMEMCAEALRIRRLKLGCEHLDIGDSCLNVANILDEWGKDDQAMKFYTEALGLYKSTLGDDDVEVANCLQYIGSMHMKKNERECAIGAYLESLRVYRSTKGDDSLEVASVLFNLGRLHAKRADYGKALGCFNECLRIRKAELGHDDVDVIAVGRFMDEIQRKRRR